MDQRQRRRLGRDPGQHAAHDARIAQVQRELGRPARLQAIERQLLHFEIGFQPGMAVDLGAELQWLARGVQPAGRVCSTGPQ